MDGNGHGRDTNVGFRMIRPVLGAGLRLVMGCSFLGPLNSSQVLAPACVGAVGRAGPVRRARGAVAGGKTQTPMNREQVADSRAGL
jgi:hypothetical protein